jgi:ribosomal protein S18 acetylase RimI-like enzyme
MALDPVSGTRVRMRARLLTGPSRERAEQRLAAEAQRNLLLLDLLDQIGRDPSPSEMPAQVLGAFDGEVLCGVAALRPSLVLEADLEERVLDALLPYFEAIDAGLVKSPRPVVDLLWRRLERRGKRALIDRIEHALALRPARARRFPAPPGVQIRPAAPTDLDALVHAARASLREEGRPDPFDGDPAGFRRWVRGRLVRARVAEVGGRVVFVSYADVQRPDGWLVQGVYTWPEHRRRGIGAAGMTALAQEAFAHGADHVQLAVVVGNEPALTLYDRLGFAPFDELRTILFF